MAQQRIVCDAILSSDNQGGVIGDIDDDPDSPDTLWLSSDGSGNGSFHGSFSAVDAGNTLDGTQEFRVLARKDAPGGSDGTIAVYLYEAGVEVSVVAATAALTDTTAIYAGTWEAASLSDQSGADVEIWVDLAGGGGPQANRRAMEIGAIEWNASTVAAGAYNAIPVILHNYRNMGYG